MQQKSIVSMPEANMEFFFFFAVLKRGTHLLGTGRQDAVLSKWPADGTLPLVTSPLPVLVPFLAQRGQALGADSVLFTVSSADPEKEQSTQGKELCLWIWLAFEKLAGAKGAPGTLMMVYSGLTPSSTRQGFVTSSKSFQAFGGGGTDSFINGVISTPSHTLWS